MCVYGTPPPRNYCPNLLKKNFKHIFPEIGKCVYVYMVPPSPKFIEENVKNVFPKICKKAP